MTAGTRRNISALRLYGDVLFRLGTQRLNGHIDQRAIIPPSITNSAPVMNDDSSDAR